MYLYVSLDTDICIRMSGRRFVNVRFEVRVITMRNIILYHIITNVTMTNLRPDILIQISMSSDAYKYKKLIASYKPKNNDILFVC